MKYIKDWNKTEERFKAFWQRELLDRCCISINTCKEGFVPEELPEKKEDKIKYWTDAEWILDRNIKRFENSHFFGDSFPLITLNLGAAGHAGYFTGVRYQAEDTMWFFPDHEKIEDIEFNDESFLYKKTFEIARYLVSRGNGDFFVSMPDVSGNADALAHIRGSENLLLDIAMEEDYIKPMLNEIQNVWEITTDKSYDIVKDNNMGGSCIGWLQTWAPGLHGQLQCDMSVMISPETFEKYILEELERQSSFLEYPLYHFDGIEQLRHIDMLLSTDLRAIQWTCVEGQPSILNYINDLKKIQAAGKCLLLKLTDNSTIVPLMEELSSRGLYLVLNTETYEEAKTILGTVTKLTHE